MELTINSVVYIFDKYVRTNKQVILTRFITCIVYYLFGLFLVTDVRKFTLSYPIFSEIITNINLFKGGLHILDLLDKAVGGFPFLLIGLLEFIAIGWIYGRVIYK